MNKLKYAILFTLILIPVAMSDTLAQSVNDDFTISNSTLSGFISDDEPIGPVGIVSELYKAHSDVTDVIIENTLAINSVGYVDEQVYLEGTWVDEAKNKLVLLLDPVQALDPLDIDDIQEGWGF